MINDGYDVCGTQQTFGFDSNCAAYLLLLYYDGKVFECFACSRTVYNIEDKIGKDKYIWLGDPVSKEYQGTEDSSGLSTKRKQGVSLKQSTDGILSLNEIFHTCTINSEIFRNCKTSTNVNHQLISTNLRKPSFKWIHVKTLFPIQ